jgi:hypothetical protein
MTDTLTELRTWLLRARHDAASTEDALESAIAIYQAAAAQIDAAQAVQADAKLLVTEIMTETGETNVTTKAGKAYVTAPSKIVTYDAKGIDKLAGLDDELAAVLEPFRRVTERAGVLTIRAPREG